MPLTYRIDPEASLLLITGHGVITQAERVDGLRTWLSDPAFKPGLDTLCDFSETLSTPTLDELRELVAIVQEHSEAIGRVRLAIVTSRPITFGIARVFEALADVEGAPLQVKVFFERKPAWAWLRPGAPDRGSPS